MTDRNSLFVKVPERAGRPGPGPGGGGLGGRKGMEEAEMLEVLAG